MIDNINPAKNTYQSNITSLNDELGMLKKQSATTSMLRLVSFLIGALIFIPEMAWYIKVAEAFLCLIAYLILLVRHKRTKDKIILKNTLVRINEEELKACDLDYANFKDGSEFSDPSHPFSFDLDLFGKNSFFQFLNRTGSIRGYNKLVEVIRKPLMENEKIKNVQGAVSELTERVDLRQEVMARTQLCGETQDDLLHVTEWIKNNKPKAYNSIQKILLWIVPAYSIGLTILLSLDLLSPFLFVALIVLPLIIPAVLLKRTTATSKALDKGFKSISKYYETFDLLSKSDPKSKYLKKVREASMEARVGLKSLSQIVGEFDQRANLLVVFMNIYFAWDLRCLIRFQEWNKMYSGEIENWFEQLSDFEWYSSLANYHFNNKEFMVMPSLNEGYSFEFKQLSHPFIPVVERVNNDFTIANQQFAIITGANMAGKSTFLRSVGLNLIVAQIGGPVIASEFKFKPVRLFSSMRTSDSLQNSRSYFYSELQRLSTIVEASDKEDPLFIILDEILKGTNSNDKAEGSYLFLEKLIGQNAMGVIATHDLSLCEIENKYPKICSNYFFDVKIGDSDLEFDYVLRPGICKNMNATFLMKKMGVIN